MLIPWSYISLFKYLFGKNLLTQLLLNYLRIHEPMVFKIFDEYLIKCLPFFHDVFLRRGSSCSPNILVVIFPQLYCFHPQTVRINLRPNILAIIINHHASIQYLQSYFMCIILECTISLYNFLLYFMCIHLRRN